MKGYLVVAQLLLATAALGQVKPPSPGVSTVPSPPSTSCFSTTVLDPTTFTLPSPTELNNAVDPTHMPTVSTICNEQVVYVVLKVLGTAWTLPLTPNQLIDFAYAFNNVTGMVFQYKGAVVSVPNVYPAAPDGLPQVLGGPPPSPVVTAAPITTALPMLVPSPSPSPSPLRAPARLPAANPSALKNATAPKSILPPRTAPAPAKAPVAGRRKLLSAQNHENRHLQQTSGPAYSGGYPSSGTSSGPYYASAPAYAPSSYIYYPPSPGALPSPPSPVPSPVPTTTSPVLVTSPAPPIIPSPVNPVVPTNGSVFPVSVPPPPAPDGIWYFVAMPMTYARMAAVGNALAEDTQAGGPEKFLKSLQASGIAFASNVQLRYIGNASSGVMDLSQQLTGQIFNKPVATNVAPSPPPPSSLSTAAIGGIVGGVVGAVLLVVLICVFVASHNRRARRERRDSLTQQWKEERERAEAERSRLSTPPSKNASLFTMMSGRQSGSSPVSQTELERQRSVRRMEIMQAEARLSGKQLGARELPSAPVEKKQSRLESLQEALGMGAHSSSKDVEARDSSHPGSEEPKSRFGKFFSRR